MSNLTKGWIAFMVIGLIGHYVFAISPTFWETVLVIGAYGSFRGYADRGA